MALVSGRSFGIAFGLVVIVLVVGLVGSAMAAPTIGRLTSEERRARLAHMLGIRTILFGVGQMYHVQAHDPLGFFWAIGALAMAVVMPCLRAEACVRRRGSASSAAGRPGRLLPRRLTATGPARRYEEAMFSRRLYADVVIDDDGKVRLKDLVIRPQ